MNNKHIYRLKSGEEIRWKKNHHGFVLVYAGRNQYSQRVYEIRKPTVIQRRAIIFNHIRENDGKPFKIHWLADKLGVSDRTIQSDIRYFEKNGLISSTPNYGNDAREKGYVYHFTYSANTMAGLGTSYTIKSLYQMSNPVGYRTWLWQDFKIRLDMDCYEIENIYDELNELKQEQAVKKDKTQKKIIEDCHKKMKERHGEMEM